MADKIKLKLTLEKFAFEFEEVERSGRFFRLGLPTHSKALWTRNKR